MLKRLAYLLSEEKAFHPMLPQNNGNSEHYALWPSIHPQVQPVFKIPVQLGFLLPVLQTLAFTFEVPALSPYPSPPTS